VKTLLSGITDAGLLLDGCRTLPHVGDALADVVDVPPRRR
jgi:hypothetical protein